jgi:predicted Zn-dependent protease
MLRRLCALLLTLLLLGLTACEAATSLLIPPDQEVALGRQVHRELSGQLRFHSDAEVQAWFERLGESVLARVPRIRSAYDFHFYVVDDPDVINAFAAPGGGIYMYTGLILAAGSEAEVVGVLGHEIAHVIERHGAKRLVATLGTQQVLDIVLGQGASGLARLVSSLASSGALLKYSRTNELDADSLGVSYVIDAGWDPRGLVEFFDRLRRMGGSGPQFLSTHPHPANRVRRLEQIIAAQPSVPTHRGDAAAFTALQRRIAGIR